MFDSSAISKSGHLRVKLSSEYCNLVISYIKLSDDLLLLSIKTYVITTPITDDEIKYQLILYANEKRAVFPVDTTKAYKNKGGERVLPHLFLTSALDGWKWWLPSFPSRCTPEREPRYEMNRWLGGPQSWSESFG